MVEKDIHAVKPPLVSDSNIRQIINLFFKIMSLATEIIFSAFHDKVMAGLVLS